MQSFFFGDDYRIEYSDGDFSNLQHCMVDFDTARDLLKSFHEGRDPYRTASNWAPTKMPGKRIHFVILILCVLMLLLLIGFLTAVGVTTRIH